MTVLALALGFATSSQAVSPTGVEIGDAVVVTADVMGIDKADRIVTLVGRSGNTVDIEAGDEVRNFDRIKVGDKVTVTYYESVALYGRFLFVLRSRIYTESGQQLG